MIFRALALMLLQATAADPLMESIALSGRVVSLAESPSERVAVKPQVAPGPPPLFGFRYLEGKQRHRFGDLDLVLDDAGH
jgi:hypothetical protein